MSLDWDDSYDFDMSPIETTESSTQTSPISEEEELLLKEHIQFHSEMKDFLERALLKGQNEGVLALRVFIKNKPKKPKTSLNRLFLEDNSPQNDETESSTHEYLKTKLTQESLPIFSSLSLSDSESWNTVSEKIKNTNQRCQRGSGVCLSGHIQLGHLLEAGAKLYRDEKLLGRAEGTFDEWIRKNVQMSSRHARKLRAVARVIQPFPRLHNLALSLTEVYQRLPSIRRVLEIQEYKEFWSLAS
ncbi:hypothetical protein OS493_020784 [Desmophyllum pertusum]|uniref:Uncharacterized protein n=1 Tax=Desmophyllum pertusum TaxID=174260 RepID=A0A9W9YMW5_9CNID|nr:hypothetical protein OS493_020784 [Desmophyllum pertusum]